MLEGQIAAYKMDHKKIPTLVELEEGDYLPGKNTKCPNGDNITINSTTGKVTSG